MAANRSGPFQLALAELRRRLAGGEFPAESRLAAGVLAPELGLSPTPVREALARLAGEGLLEERRGQGFFVRRLSARDVADLYGLALAHLRIALGDRSGAPAASQGRSPWPVPPPAACSVGEGSPWEAEPVAAADRLLAAWVREGGGAVLVRSFLRVQLQLARVRRLEPRHLRDLVEEYAGLHAQSAAPPPARAAAARAFYRRRIRLARRLAEHLEPSAPIA